MLLNKTAEQQRVNLSGELHECRGCSPAKGLWKPSPGRRTPEQVPSASPAPPQQLPLNVEEEESTVGKGASGEGTSSQGGERMENLDSKSDLDNMTEVWPPVPPATREAPAAEPGAGAAGMRKSTPRHRRSPLGGPISVAPTASSSSSSSDDSCTSSDSSNGNDSGDFPALARRSARDLEVFGEFLSLQSRRTRSQSRGLTMSASYADALLAYAMRAVKAKKTMEERLRKSNEPTVHCWKRTWRRNVSGSRRSRGLVRY